MLNMATITVSPASVKNSPAVGRDSAGVGMNSLQQNDVYSIALSEYPDVLSIEQVSHILGVCMKTGYKLIRDNKITGIKVGRAYRVPKIYLINYLYPNIPC